MKSDRFLLEQLMLLSNGMPGAAERNRRTSSHMNLPPPDFVSSGSPVDVQHEIQLRRNKGESFHEIAVALNECGLRGPYGGRWYASSVRVAAKNTNPGN